jgi:hypothetical protein
MQTLIHNYGLFWRSEDVFWGRPRVRGSLKGRKTGEALGDPVDFREQAGVYVLYDDNFRVVYMGQAGAGNQTLLGRLKQHRKVKWVRQNGKLSVGAEQKSIKAAHILNHIEAILISAVEPPHNKQGGRFGDDVEQYLQYRDQGLDPDIGSMVKELWKQAKLA